MRDNAKGVGRRAQILTGIAPRVEVSREAPCETCRGLIGVCVADTNGAARIIMIIYIIYLL